MINNETMDTSKVLNNIKIKEYSPKYPMNKSYNFTSNSIKKPILNKNSFDIHNPKFHYIPNQIRKNTNLKYNNNFRINSRSSNLHYGKNFNSYNNL